MTKMKNLVAELAPGESVTIHGLSKDLFVNGPHLFDGHERLEGCWNHSDYWGVIEDHGYPEFTITATAVPLKVRAYYYEWGPDGTIDFDASDDDDYKLAFDYYNRVMTGRRSES